MDLLFFFLEKGLINVLLTAMEGQKTLQGLIIVFLVFLSAVLAAYELLLRFLNPRPVDFLGAVAIAYIVGFIGNELVSRFRIKIWNEIVSVALIADGYHARADGFTSLALLFGAFGV